MELTVGKLMGNYRIVQLLGEGGMGRVYLAEHTVLGTQRALKVLPDELSRNAGLISRFQDEARVMAHLEHPHLVRVHDTGVAGDVRYLVMDYVVGPNGVPTNLQQRLDDAPAGRLPESDVYRWAVQLAQALEYAHGNGVIHRDIKPANVLLDQQGSARLADFGLVKMVGDGFLRTRFQQTLSHERTRYSGSGADTLDSAATQGVPGKDAVMGTLDYMAPEQREGRADARTDVYALGVMLYRLLTGRLPQGRFKLPTELLSHLSPEWDEVVERCLATDPSERFATGRELSEALAGIAAGARRRKSSRQAVVETVRPPETEVVQEGAEVAASASDSLSALAASAPDVRTSGLPRSRRKSPATSLVVGALAVVGATVAIIIMVAVASSDRTDNRNEEKPSAVVAPPSAAQTRETRAQKEFERIKSMDGISVLDRIGLYREMVIEPYLGTIGMSLAVAEVQKLERELNALREADAKSEYDGMLVRLERDFPALDARVLRLQKFIDNPRFADTKAVEQARLLTVVLRLQIERIKTTDQIRNPPAVSTLLTLVFEPADAVVRIDGQPKLLSSSGRLELRVSGPGSVAVSAEASGYDSLSKTFTFGELQSIDVIRLQPSVKVPSPTVKNDTLSPVPVPKTEPIVTKRSVTPTESGFHVVWSDAAGRFIEHKQPGKLMLGNRATTAVMHFRFHDIDSTNGLNLQQRKKALDDAQRQVVDQYKRLNPRIKFGPTTSVDTVGTLMLTRRVSFSVSQ